MIKSKLFIFLFFISAGGMASAAVTEDMTNPMPVSELPSKELASPTSADPSLTAPSVIEPKAKAKTKKKAHTVRLPKVEGNDPDFKREEYFHNIYSQYNLQPTSQESWEKATAGRKFQAYQVQKGDTLWDLSYTFFGDSQYWPKLWSLNSDKIQNPHEINSLSQIQFYPGSMNEAPTLGVTQGEVAGTVAQQKQTDAVKVASNVVIAPLPPGKKSVPVLENIPPSLPRTYIEMPKGPTTPPEFPDLKRVFAAADEPLAYYVSDTIPTSAGEVVEAELEMRTATENQYVIVRVDNPEVKKLYAFKEIDKVVDITNTKHKAHLIEVQGELTILDKVNEEKGLYRAMVTKIIQPIYVGAKLTAGKIPMISTAMGNMQDSPGATIIGGQADGERDQLEEKALVFLNMGSSQGVQVGQAFKIYTNSHLRNANTQIRVNELPIGILKVVHVSESFATAYLLNMTEAVVVGDFVGVSHLPNSSTVESKEEKEKPTDSEGADTSSSEAPADAEGSSELTPKVINPEDFTDPTPDTTPAPSTPTESTPSTPGSPSSSGLDF